MSMSSSRRFFVAFAATACFISSALAQVAHGTKDEAKAMVDAAVAHVKKVGAEQAFKDFTTDKAHWSSKDLYVMAYDNTGTCVGHGANAKLIGKNLIDMKDPGGKMVVKELIATSKKGGGWVDYEWPNPLTKKIESKSTYARQLEGFDGWVGVGIYR